MQRYILLVSSIFSLVFAGIASTLPLGIYNQGQVSAFYPTLFTPATFTFSIWSIIYLSWILLGIFIALKNIKLRDENLYLLALAQVLSSFWLIPSQFLFIGTSFIVMMWVLYMLLLCFYLSRDENPYFKLTVELFLAWIIVASIANFHLMLVYYNIYFFSETLTLISIIIAWYIFYQSVTRYHTVIPSLVLLWSGFWIIVWQDNSHIQMTAWIICAWIIFVLIFKYKKHFIHLFYKFKSTKK
mgnify:CR=1 FL=1